MSAAIMENEVEEKPRRRKKANRHTQRDRVQVLLKPHIRMRMDRLADEEGFEGSLGLFGRQLILEALEARGYSANQMMAEWHAEMSEYALKGETHPFSK